MAFECPTLFIPSMTALLRVRYGDTSRTLAKLFSADCRWSSLLISRSLLNTITRSCWNEVFSCVIRWGWKNRDSPFSSGHFNMRFMKKAYSMSCCWIGQARVENKLSSIWKKIEKILFLSQKTAQKSVQNVNVYFLEI